jgi:hypothetical protein
MSPTCGVVVRLNHQFDLDAVALQNRGLLAPFREGESEHLGVEVEVRFKPPYRDGFLPMSQLIPETLLRTVVRDITCSLLRSGTVAAAGRQRR